MNKILAFFGYYHKDDVMEMAELFRLYGYQQGHHAGYRDRVIDIVDCQIERAIASTRTKEKA